MLRGYILQSLSWYLGDEGRLMTYGNNPGYRIIKCVNNQYSKEDDEEESRVWCTGANVQSSSQ